MSCYNSTVVPAPADEVWARIRDFHDMSWAAGVIESCDRIGQTPGSQIGAKRILNGVFHETLRELDDSRRIIRYSIDDGPGPVARDRVANYVGEVTVMPVTDANSSFVLWTSSWEQATGNVAEFCNPIYRALLDALKRSFS